MTAPSFVNNSTWRLQSFNNSATPNMPASITAGNILIGVALAHVASGKTFSWSSGWTEFYSYNTSDFSVSLAYKVAVGSDSSPTATMSSGFTDIASIVFQYTGQASGTDWIGNQSLNKGTSASMSGTAVNTASADATAFALAFWNTQGSSVSGSPSTGWTQRGASGLFQICDEAEVSPATVDAFTQALTGSATWGVIEQEIRSVAAASGINLTAAIADDTGLSATLTASWKLSAAIADDTGLSATLSTDAPLVAAIADDTGLSAALSVSGTFSLIGDFMDDAGLAAVLTVPPLPPPIQTVVICV